MNIFYDLSFEMCQLCMLRYFFLRNKPDLDLLSNL